MTRRPTDDRDALVAITVAGRISPARLYGEGIGADAEGRSIALPGHGGIAIGVHVGDAVTDYLGDHLMVGASIEDDAGEPALAGPLHLSACLGNRVREATGRGIGVVVGKRGGLAPGFLGPQLVSVEVPDERLGALQPGDRVIVEAVGRGLSLPDHPDVGVLNLSPTLLDELPIDDEDGTIAIPVRAMVPATAAGPGMGQDGWVGDVEIADMTQLEGERDLRFGDLVAVTDLDGRISRFPRAGYVSVGVVSHGPSRQPGHGIGLTVILSGLEGDLRAAISSDASLASAMRAAASRASA